MPLSPEYHHHLTISKLLVYILRDYAKVYRDKITIATCYKFYVTLFDSYIYRDAEIAEKPRFEGKIHNYVQNRIILITNTISQLILYNCIKITLF